ncbi:uncharacterized protein LOC107812111 [Nicotiana tabacum]|uniref:Uncharacterized protein LOC107812111 n=1 Tax=Nicotiana tabacum TaxID=4097 RepID=A0A1S4BUT0_TOBAC|nr:PREDICTED: uncharacterized protein LOC107812111 [Nicotiana tabacum]
MEVLSAYEVASGQLINKSKSTVYVHLSTNDDAVRKVQRITGIQRQDFPFTYLGCPIFYSTRRINYYEGLIKKILDQLQSWKGKLMSMGGREVLISHVLQSMTIHLLSAVNPPAFVINKPLKLFARFFWSNSIDGRARHWASWPNLSCHMKKKVYGLGLYMVCLRPYSVNYGGTFVLNLHYGALS